LNFGKAHQHNQYDHDKFITNVGQMMKISRSITYLSITLLDGQQNLHPITLLDGQQNLMTMNI
jgi:hypothetical protein